MCKLSRGVRRLGRYFAGIARYLSFSTQHKLFQKRQNWLCSKITVAIISQSIIPTISEWHYQVMGKVDGIPISFLVDKIPVGCMGSGEMNSNL